jgi:hypothetical protein
MGTADLVGPIVVGLTLGLPAVTVGTAVVGGTLVGCTVVGLTVGLPGVTVGPRVLGVKVIDGLCTEAGFS